MKQDHQVCKEHIYNSIYKSHAKSIWRFIYFKCGNEAKADDLVQEAFIKLWKNCKKVSVEKSKSFLYRVANNMFLNEVAHQKVVLRHVKQQKISFNNESPEFVLQEKEFSEKLHNAINNLTEAQRTAFLLNRIEGKKYREIAEILEISVKAVEKRMSLALAALRKDIENI